MGLAKGKRGGLPSEDISREYPVSLMMHWRKGCRGGVWICMGIPFQEVVSMLPEDGRLGIRNLYLPMRHRKSPNAEFARGSLRSRGEELCTPTSGCYPLV